MPSPNVIKTYIKDGIYHIYNRGVEKRRIFEDEKDYKVFLKYLKDNLDKPPEFIERSRIVNVKGSTFNVVPKPVKNFNKVIDLLAYCLMPNHFHLLVKQNDKDSLKVFMRSLATRYSMYFNKRYDRVGPLFQGIYKAALVSDDLYLLHLSKYIHLNPIEISKNIVSAYSSYADYLGLKHTTWVKPNLIVSFFKSAVGKDFKKFNDYKDFVEKIDYSGVENEDKDVLGRLTID